MIKFLLAILLILLAFVLFFPDQTKELFNPLEPERVIINTSNETFVNTNPVAVNTTSTKDDIDLQQLSLLVHELINKERTSRGLTPLSYDGALQTIAEGHSEDMVNRNYFSHYSPEGLTFSDRYAQRQYSCRVPVEDVAYTGAENIAIIPLVSTYELHSGTPLSYNTLEGMAALVVDGWMKSKGHRENILKPYWSVQGIGIGVNESLDYYVTQNFC
ncbi:hypothetical protein GF342_05510 [Candidatus Woesearchaeota archaeon]|nr:hypothetical protein [Candidatus Woesearchaeota archaeon]